MVLTREEVKVVLAGLDDDTMRCMAQLLYGAGLRSLECARLRIKDVDFGRGVITILDGKGGRGRITMLPEAARPGLREQIKAARLLYDADRANQLPGAQLPHAMAVKSRETQFAWPWFWIFPPR